MNQPKYINVWDNNDNIYLSNRIIQQVLRPIHGNSFSFNLMRYKIRPDTHLNKSGKNHQLNSFVITLIEARFSRMGNKNF